MQKYKILSPMVLFVIALMVVASGCQPSSLVSDPGTKSVPTFAHIDAPYNPDYMVANYHNNILDYYSTHVHTTLPQHKIADTVYHFLKDSIVMVTPTYREFTDTLASLSNQYSLTGLIDHYYSTGVISLTVRNYLFTYVNIIDSVETSYDSAQYMARLDQVDQAVVAAITDSTVHVPLVFSATIRGSYIYWTTQWNNPATLWDLSAWKSRAEGKSFTPMGTVKAYILNIIGADGRGALEAAGGTILGSAIVEVASGGTATPLVASAVVDAAIAGGGWSSLIAVLKGP